ncbi:hypothetical protein MKW92_018437 [Papaver armeniacum]|nr:hypothetical protein MKW92_018437 [Papaver armeniacum]
MQVYGNPNSWTRRYTVTHKIISSQICFYRTSLKFMWSFKNGVILFREYDGLYLYDPVHGSVIERKVNHLSAENYSESLVSLNSGTYVGGRTANSSYTELEILKHRNSVLQAHNIELEARDAQLVVQKEAQESQKYDEEDTALTKKNSRKGKAEYEYNTRRASKAVATVSSSTNFEDESLTVQQRAEKELANLVLLPLPTGGTLEPYEINGHLSNNDRKDLLKERGLMVKGNKDELIARLRGI